jgi:hypothetical protein
LPFFSVTLHLWRETIFIVTSYTWCQNFFWFLNVHFPLLIFYKIVARALEKIFYRKQKQSARCISKTRLIKTENRGHEPIFPFSFRALCSVVDKSFFIAHESHTYCLILHSLQNTWLCLWTRSEHLQLRLWSRSTKRTGVRCWHQVLGAVCSRKLLQLPQEFTLHFLETQQDFRLGSAFL